MGRVILMTGVLPAIVLAGLIAVGCTRDDRKAGPAGQRWDPPRGSWRLSARQVRHHAQAMADVLARADAIVVYGWVPGDRNLSSPDLEWVKLGEIYRVGDGGEWARMVEAVRSARKEDRVLSSAVVLKLELIQQGKVIAVATLLPPDGEMAMRADGKEYGRVWVGPGMREAFQEYWDEAVNRFASVPGPLPANRPGVRAAPPATPAEFTEVKWRVAELFRSADFGNIAKKGFPRGVEGIETVGKHREAWSLMAQGVEEAQPGWPTRAWPPDVMIRPMLPSPPRWSKLRDFDLYYKGGILYSEDPALGGGKNTLKPSAKFQQGLEMLLETLPEKE